MFPVSWFLAIGLGFGIFALQLCMDGSCKNIQRHSSQSWKLFLIFKSWENKWILLGWLWYSHKIQLLYEPKITFDAADSGPRYHRKGPIQEKMHLPTQCKFASGYCWQIKNWSSWTKLSWKAVRDPEKDLDAKMRLSCSYVTKGSDPYYPCSLIFKDKLMHRL